MCLGQASQIKKLDLRLKYLRIENELQLKIINQLKTLHETSRRVEHSHCQEHVRCKINHRQAGAELGQAQP